MHTTKLSSKGQVIIPKFIRTSHNWMPGQDLVVIEMEDGVLLKPKTPFPPTTLKEVAAILMYQGEPKTLEDMQNAIKKGIKEKFL